MRSYIAKGALFITGVYLGMSYVTTFDDFREQLKPTPKEENAKLILEYLKDNYHPQHRR